MKALFRFHHLHKCKSCPERFSSNTQLHRHIEASHANKTTETSQSSTSAASPSLGIPPSSPPPSPVPFAETQASSPPSKAPPSQTLPAEIPTRLSHETCSNSSVSLVNPREIQPQAPCSTSSQLPLTPLPSPSSTRRESNRSTPRQTNTTAPPPQSPPPEIPARSSHELCLNSSLSPITPRQTLPTAPPSQAPSIETPLTPPPSPSIKLQELSRSTTRQTIFAASCFTHPLLPSIPYRELDRSSPRHVISQQLSPLSRTQLSEMKGIIENPSQDSPAIVQAVTPASPQSPTTLLSHYRALTKESSENVVEKAQAAAAPPPTPRPSSQVLSTGKYETSSISPPKPLAAPYVLPHKRQNPYITIGDLFAKFGALPRPSPPEIIRRSSMTMHELLIKFRSSNSHGSRWHSNSHSSILQRKLSNQKQALMSAPSS